MKNYRWDGQNESKPAVPSSDTERGLMDRFALFITCYTSHLDTMGAIISPAVVSLFFSFLANQHIKC